MTSAEVLLLSLLMVSSGATVCAAMPADAQDPRNAESVRAGRAVAERVCARCHAVGRTGESPNPKSPPFRTIVARHGADHLPGALFLDGTVLRHPGMPQFEFQTVEVDGLIAYIRSLAHE
jgi:mono/diheme cytochrome c family protein